MNNIVREQAEKTRAFPLGPDSLALFPGRDHRRALEGLSEDLRRGGRLLCLVGPAGIGKSMVLRSLRARLQRGFVGEIAQPPLGELLSRLADSIGAARGDEAEVLRRLRDMSAAGSRPERLPIIQIIDDAETLSRADVLLVRRLFERVQGQVLLVGQPQLLELFSGEEGAVPPPERIYHLEPLSADEVGAYIRHRLNEAGLDRGLFEPEAAAAVCEYSGGVPRLINLLCFAVLADTCFNHETPVTAERVHDAARLRAHHGGYPFVRPPPAPRVEPAPPPSENIALVVEDGWRRAPAPASAEAGFARTLWIMVAGVLLGVAAARLPVSEDLNAGSLSRTATSLSASVGQTLQRMDSALGDVQASLTSWFSSESSPEAAPNVASFEENPPAAEHAVVAAGGKPPPATPAVGAAQQDKPAAAARDGNDDSERSRLTLAQRRHLAQLYTERAQYEMNSGRWGDARISIQRGLQLAPDDAALQGLDHHLGAESDRQPAAPPAAEAALAEAQPKPDKDKITQLYLQRAEYEWQNGRLQDALVSINYGLEEDPRSSPLLDMRGRVMEELAAQRR